MRVATLRKVCGNFPSHQEILIGDTLVDVVEGEAIKPEQEVDLIHRPDVCVPGGSGVECDAV